MILLAWVIAGIAMAVAVAGARGRVTPFLATAAVLCLALPGYASLANTYGRSGPFWAYAAGMLLLAGSYAVARRGLPAVAARPPMARPGLAAVAIPALVVTLLTAYHFSQVGVALLQSDVEMRRFAFTASGLFGLPGRALLFGILICTYLAVAYASACGRGPSRPGALLVAMAVVLVASRLAMGFKSGVLEAVLTLVIAGVLAWRPPRLGRATVALAIPAGVAVAFAMVVSGLYGTVVSSDQPTLAYLGDRSTVIQAIPGFDVLDDPVPMPLGEENTLVNDLRYYVPKYLGMDPGPGRYPFVLIESAAILGTTPDNAAFLAPVTVGAFAGLVRDFGAAGFLLFALAGVAIARLEHRAATAGSILAFTAWVTAIVALGSYLQKGDLVYTVLNWGAMLVLVALLHGAGTLVAGRRRPAAVPGPLGAAA